MVRFLGVLLLLTVNLMTSASTNQNGDSQPWDRVKHLRDFQVIEFRRYRAAGAREAGVLVTLDVPNNFPRLPFRTDGPYLVWLGILRDNQMLEQRFAPLAERSAKALSATNLLRETPELVVLDPTRRSRLRWLREVEK